jgi:hypothetical protein
VGSLAAAFVAGASQRRAHSSSPVITCENVNDLVQKTKIKEVTSHDKDEKADWRGGGIGFAGCYDGVLVEQQQDGYQLSSHDCVDRFRVRGWRIDRVPNKGGSDLFMHRTVRP